MPQDKNNPFAEFGGAAVEESKAENPFAEFGGMSVEEKKSPVESGTPLQIGGNESVSATQFTEGNKGGLFAPAIPVTEEEKVAISAQEQPAQYKIDGVAVTPEEMTKKLFQSETIDKLQQGSIRFDFPTEDVEMSELIKKQAESGGRIGDVWENVKAGTARLGAGVVGLKSYAANLLRLIPALKDVPKGIDEAVSEEVANKLIDYAKEEEGKVRQYEDGFINEVQQGNIGNATGIMFNTLGQSTPMIASIIATSGAGAVPAIGLTGTAFASSEFADDEAKKLDGKELSPQEKVLRATGYGFAESVFGQIPTGKILSKNFPIIKEGIKGFVGKAAQVGGKEAAEKVATEAAKQSALMMAKGMGVDATKEIGGEVITEWTQMGIDDYLGVADYTIEDYQKRGAEAAALSLGMTGFMQTPQTVKLAKQIADENIKKTGGKNIVDKAKQKQEAGEITPQQLDVITINVEKRADAINAVPDEYVGETEIVDLVQQKQELDEKAKGVDPVFKEEINEQKKVVEEQLKIKVEEIKNTDAQLTDLANRIAKGEKIESTEDLQLQANYPTELENKLKDLTAIPEAKEGVTEKTETDEKETQEAEVLTEELANVEATAKALEGVDVSNLQNVIPKREKLSHQLIKDENTTTVDNMTKDGQLIPSDFYTNPEFYANLSEPTYKESWNAIKKLKGNPDAEITIYRSAPEGSVIEEGDWVSLSKRYAKEEGMHPTDESQDMPVISMKVKAKEVVWDGNDINEFAYYPETSKSETQKISEAYHKAKADGSNPELVKAVEDLLTTKIQEDAKEQPKEFAAKSERYFEYVPIEEIEQYREFDREKEPKWGSDDKSLDKLIEKIKNEGIKEPIVLDVYEGKGIVVEGNTRLAAAKKLGIKNIPVRINQRSRPFKGTIYEAKAKELPSRFDSKKAIAFGVDEKNVERSAQAHGFNVINKPQEDAIQIKTASQVPIQPKATDSGKVEKGTPEAKPKTVAEEGKEEVTGKELEPHEEVKTDVETVIAELGLKDADIVLYNKLKGLPKEERVGMLEVLSDEQDDNIREAEKKIDELDDKRDDIDRAIDDIDEDETLSDKEKEKKLKPLRKQYRETEKQEKQLKKDIDKFEEIRNDIDKVRFSDYAEKTIDELVNAVDTRLETRKGVKLGYDLFPELANIPEFIPIQKEIQTQIDNGTITAEQVEAYGNQSAEQVESNEPIIEDIEGKAESDNEVELNEAIERADELIGEPTEIDKTLSKYGWTTKKKGNDIALINRKGNEVATVKQKGNKYAIYDNSGNKLLSGTDNVSKGAEKVAKEYFYAKEIAPTTEKPKAKDLIAEGFDDLLSAIGGKADITGDKRKSVIDALVKIGNGLIQQGIATADNVYDKIREFIKSKGVNLSDEDLNDVEQDVVSVFQPREQVSGIKKALVSEEKIAETNIQKRTVKEMLDLGRQLVDEGKINPQAITSDIANGNARALQPNEVAALVYYKTQLDNKIDSVNRSMIKNQAQGNYEAELSDKAELAQLNQQLDDYHTMQLKTAYEQSLAFSLRKMLLDSEYNLQTQIEKYKANNGGTIPPDVEARFRQYDAELKEAQQKIKEFEAEKQQREDAETIRKIKEAVKRKPQQKRPTIYGKTRVAKGVDDLASALGARSMAYGVNRPKITAALTEIGVGLIEEGVATAENVIQKVSEYVNDKFKGKIDFDEFKSDVDENIKTRLSQNVTQGKIKIPHQLIRDLVESGIDNVEDLTAAVKKEMQSEYPDATDRDIRDAITEYGKTVNPTQDEIEKKIRRMKRIGKLISGIEDARKRMRPLRSGLQRDKIDAEERKMAKELRGLINELPMAQEDIDKKMKSDLDALKTRLQNTIEDLELRLKNKDFSDKPKKPLIDLDAEAIALQAKANTIKEKYDLEHEKLKLSQRTKTEKFWDGLLDIVGLTKTMRTVMDMSAPFRQGIVFTTTRPVISSKAFVEMWKQAFSQDRADMWLSHIKASPEYALMKESGLYLSEPTAKLTAREEAFMSNLTHQLPKYMKAKGVPQILRLPVEIYSQLVRGSERAYTSYLNKIRVDVFLDTANKFADMGIDPKDKEGAKVYKAWADYVNNATGRGDLGSFEMAAQSLSTVFFSPRLIAARFNLLNPSRYVSMPKEVRKEALKSTLGMLSIGATAVGLAALAGADVEDDWRSSDFMKIKIGNTRIDLWGGFQQWVRLLGQLVTGERKKTSTGEIVSLGGYGKDTRWNLLIDFFKNKLAPAPALAVKYAESSIDKKTGKREAKYGEELDVSDDLLEQAIPLYLADIDELAKEQGLLTTGILGLLSFFGVGVQNYGQKQKPPEKEEIEETEAVEEETTEEVVEQGE